MGGPTQGAQRLLRAVLLGAASTLLAALAHVAGGGHLPSAGALALLSAPVGTVALLVTARRCRLPLVLAVLGAEQLVLHRLLDALSGGADCLTATGGHHAHVVPVAHAATTCTAQAMAMPVPLPMVLAHVAATVVTAWLLARGERLLWRLAERALRRRVPGTPAAPSVARARLAVVPDVARPARVDVDHRSRPRAPPAALCGATG